MTHVTAATLKRLGVPSATAHRWVARAIAEGSWPTARVEGRTRPATALVMDAKAFEALIAGLRGA